MPEKITPKEKVAKIMDNVSEKSIYSKLIDAVNALPKEAIEATKKELTRKGYDTTGYQYQFLVNVMNEVCGIDGWGFDYTIIKEIEGKYASGGGNFEITVDVEIWIKVGENLAMRKCAGGHKSVLHSDALKGAITNGFKKTVSLFGVGKKAYEGALDDDLMPLPQAPTTPPKATVVWNKTPPMPQTSTPATRPSTTHEANIDDYIPQESPDDREQVPFVTDPAKEVEAPDVPKAQEKCEACGKVLTEKELYWIKIKKEPSKICYVCKKS